MFGHAGLKVSSPGMLDPRWGDYAMKTLRTAVALGVGIALLGGCDGGDSPATSSGGMAPEADN